MIPVELVSLTGRAPATDLALSIHGKNMNRTHYVNTMEFLGAFQSPARYDRLRALTTYCADHVREKLVEKFLKNAPKL